jgi:secernin
VCDSLVALPAVTGGPTLFGKNSDRPPEERQDLEFQGAASSLGQRRCTYISVDAHNHETLAVIGSRPVWGWGFEHGVNEAGVAMGNHRITTVHDPRPYPDALTGMDLVRLTLERAPSAAAGVAVLTDLLERYGQGGSGFDATTHSRTPYWSSFLIADAVDAWVIDTSARIWLAEQIVGSRSVSNRPAIASFDATYRHPDAPVEELVEPRLAVTREALRRPVLNGLHVSRQHISEALRSHDSHPEREGWSVCMHAHGVQKTTASLISKSFSGRVPRLWVTHDNPCVQGHREVAFGPRPQRV